jgi:trans-aconitate methyltransferase
VIANRIAARFPSRFLRHYVRGKMSSDPLYAAVYEHLRDRDDPILDVGCGTGILALYLRERGHRAPVRGIDHDEAKVATARALGVECDVGDARDLPPWRGSVLLLDLLHYFDDATQSRILTRIAATASMVIIRDAVRDASWRYRVTHLQESFARAIGWLKAEQLNFPTREAIAAPFANFEQEIVPLWGRTPFNNYLFVFRK